MPRPAVPKFGGFRGDVTQRVGCETSLASWLDVTGTSAHALARRIGCDTKSVIHWADGLVMPSLVLAFRLEAVTNGAVPVASWIGTERGRAEWEMAERRAVHG